MSVLVIEIFRDACVTQRRALWLFILLYYSSELTGFEFCYGTQGATKLTFCIRFVKFVGNWGIEAPLSTSPSVEDKELSETRSRYLGLYASARNYDR